MREPLTRRSLLGRTSPEVSEPIPRPTKTGIVHLGIGAFARAHSIAYTDAASARTDETRWGVLGVTGRRPLVAEALAGQEEVYGILQRDPSGATVRWIGSLTGVAAAVETGRVVAAIAHPDTSVVTLTITEKAYDVASVPMQLLAAGLRRRHALGGAPLTIISCDNLVANGRVLQRMIRDAASVARSPASFSRWLDRDIATPSSMVDRMTPETTDTDRLEASALTGFVDAGLVVAEPFSEWVIEDRFVGDRPRWEVAGATFVADVDAHEAVKLRLLNGTHTLLACAGSLLGFDTIADAVSSPELRAWCAVWQKDAKRSLAALAGHARIDLDAYAASVLERCANPYLMHATRQVARDTSQKLRVRVLLAAQEESARGRLPIGAAFAAGAWVAFVIDETMRGRALDDPRADRLAELVRSARADPARAVLPLLRVACPDDAATRWDPELLRQIADQASALLSPARRSA